MTVWTKPKHQRFADDMEVAGLEVRAYRGRFFYDGPAVMTGDGVDLQRIIRATEVDLQWENLGLDLIVYPK